MSFICNPPSVSDIEKKIKEAKEASIAIGFAGTGIPLLDALLNDIGEELSTLGSAGIASAYTAAEKVFQQTLGTAASSALAAITSVLNINAEIQAATAGTLFDTLRRQVELRRLLLNEVIFHVSGIMNILQRLNRVQTNNFDTTLKRAYPYILTAYKDITIIRRAIGSSKPRFNIALFREAIYNIDIAIGILTGDKSRALGEKFFKNVATSKSIGEMYQNFKDVMFQEVFNEYTVLAETYIWHLTNLITVLVGGYASIGFGSVDLTSNSVIPGTANNANTLLKQRQAQLNGLKKNWVSEVTPPNTFLRTLANIDSNKGLTLTHEGIKLQVSLVRDFKTNWNSLSLSAKTLWASLNPAYGTLQDIKDKVEQQLQKTSDGKIGGEGIAKQADPLLFRTWTASELEAVKQLLLTQEAAGSGFENVAQDLYIIDIILNYLNSERYQTKSEDTLNLMLTLMISTSAFAITGPLNRRLLQRGLVIFNEILTLAKNAMTEDNYLLSLLVQLNIIDNPLMATVFKILEGIALQSSLGASLIKDLTSGNYLSITSTLTSITEGFVEGVDVISDIYKKLTVGCGDSNKETAYINPKADEAMKINEDQITKSVTSANNPIDHVTPFSTLGGMLDTEIFMGSA